VENVKQDASIGTNILRVSASDEDADNNGAIVYSLSSPNNEQNLEYFEIQPESGWIVLKKPLDVSIHIKSLIYISSLFSSMDSIVFLEHTHFFVGEACNFSLRLASFFCSQIYTRYLEKSQQYKQFAMLKPRAIILALINYI